MPDNASPLAPEQAEGVGGDGTATPSQDKQPTAAPDIEARLKELQSQIESIGTKNAELSKNYANLRRAYNSKDQELAALRQQNGAATRRGGQPSADDDDPLAAHLQVLHQQTQAALLQAALAQFQNPVKNPGWEKRWDKVQEIIEDDVRVAEFAVFNADGTVNFQRTLKAVDDAVRSSTPTPSPSADEARLTAEAEKQRQKAQATISGSAASALPEGMTVEQFKRLPYKEKLKIADRMGLVDRRNPPSVEDHRMR